MALSLLALVAWGWTAARAVGARWRDRGLPWDAERVGLATLVAVAVVFGVHSAVDWTWFVPANTAAALLAAGWVAGRGPLRERVLAARASGVAAPPPTLVTSSGGLWAPALPPPAPADPPALADVAGPGASPLTDADRRPGPRFAYASAGGAALVAALALAAAWTAYQPVRSLHAGDAAIDRVTRGELDAAADVAAIAHDRNPLSTEPLWQLAFIEQSRGRSDAAEFALQQAVALQPSSAEAWRRLGRFQLSVVAEPDAAVRSFRAAYFLDPRNPTSTSNLLEASRAAGNPAPTAPPAPPPEPAP
jgi:hypothetical protein